MTDNKPRGKLPTEPGWYWRINGKGFKSVVEVYYDSFFDELIARLYHTDEMIHTEIIDEHSTSFWGPRVDEWKTEIDGSDDPPKGQS